ncbi:glycerol kinase GlpK [Kineothrix sp. MSJ-39]|uniref:glycerol kinase GlpK n=1 Tax=Kineothrix sp. MSJ-39 TaxID=2841533 RepID=UPI001C11911D|nr:glycerol kinase GlpK [Kineothrix sp. MSJ-39]MBU5428995.1 glycerol kinase GlpK [Kineothrix sp. MSJ-39]
MKKYMMALDQGTTSSRCILFDKMGNIRAKAQKEFTQIYPQEGWVEHNPKDIWSSQYSVMTEALTMLGEDECIAGIGITNQRETTIVWNKQTGEPVYNAIVWQCRRTAKEIDRLKEEEPALSAYIMEKTGLLPDPYFSASKIAWILDHVENARQEAETGNLLFGTVDTWLIWNLTRGKVHVTDYTNASRTMLFDIHTLCWDQKILDYFHIPASMLPQVKPSSCVYGYANLGSLGESIPIAGAAGDQQAALFGQCCFTPGEVKNTYGTGCFMLMHTGDRAVKSRAGLLTTIAASADGKAEYALEGSVFVAGAAIQWLRDGMHLIEQAPQTQKICESVEDTAGTMIVPAFTGMGAPYWNPYARGMVTGLTRGCQKEHFIRAIMESIAFQTMDVLTAMRADAELSLLKLKVDGGASANDFLMQFQADLLGVDVQRPRCIETTALGAAYLAGLAVGYWKDTEEIKENWQIDRVFTASMPQEKRQELVRSWKRAVDCALYYAKWEEEHD